MNFVLDYGECDDTSVVPYFNTDKFDGCDSNQSEGLEAYEYDTDTNGPMNRLREELANEMWEDWCSSC